MNCSYFSMEGRRTFKVNKKIKKPNKKHKQIQKTKKEQTSRRTKTKLNENIQTSERRVHYTRSMKYCKKLFLDSKVQHLRQWKKFTPLSATKEQLSYQHWKSEKNLMYVHFKCWLRLIPFSQYSPSNPGGHKHRYPLSVNPDWQVALFLQ